MRTLLLFIVIYLRSEASTARFINTASPGSARSRDRFVPPADGLIHVILYHHVSFYHVTFFMNRCNLI